MDENTLVYSPDEVADFLQHLPGWEADANYKSITKTLIFPNFILAMTFVTDVADLAEEEQHHPDFHVTYGTVRLSLSTHDIGGLSENDFIMAAKINQIQ